MSKKNTKRALLSSVLALVLCLSMLIGTTFAWFTDSVTSGKNQILAGNLDVELYYHNGTEYVPVTAETNLFKEDTLWEPGHTEVIYLKVANLGTLALKYQLGVNILSETEGTNKDDKTFKLSDYIEFGVIENVSTPYANRDAARKAVTDSKIISTGYSKDSELYPVDKGVSEEYVALVVYMPEEVGNVANYKTGTTAPEITLGVNLVATQIDVENDSFGNDYDAGLDPNASYVWSLDGIKDALTNGGKVILMDDIQLDSGIAVSADVDLDLNGYTLTGNGSYALNFVGGTSTVRNGSIQAAGSGKNVSCLWTEQDAVVNLYDVNLTSGTTGTNTNIPVWTDGTSVLNIYSGEYINGNGGHVVYAGGDSVVSIYGGHFDSAENYVSGYTWAMINDQDNGDATITVYGGSFVAFDPADENDAKTGDGSGNSASFVADGYTSVPVTVDGLTWFYVVPETATVAADSAGLAEAVSDGVKTVYLLGGEYELKGNQANGLTVIGLDDAVKVSNLTNFAGNGNLGAIWQNVNFENVIFTEKVYTMAGGAQSSFKNCTFEQGFRGGHARGVTFTGCTFYANSEGFAMHFEKVYTTVTVTDCDFVEGTIAFGDNGDGLVTFNDCTFSGETTRTEYFDAWASCVLNDCVFAEGTEIWLEHWETGESVTLNNTTGATVVQK